MASASRTDRDCNNKCFPQHQGETTRLHEGLHRRRRLRILLAFGLLRSRIGSATPPSGSVLSCRRSRAALRGERYVAVVASAISMSKMRALTYVLVASCGAFTIPAAKTFVFEWVLAMPMPRLPMPWRLVGQTSYRVKGQLWRPM
jgi:hypothetical protein